MVARVWLDMLRARRMHANLWGVDRRGARATIDELADLLGPAEILDGPSRATAAASAAAWRSPAVVATALRLVSAEA